MAHLIPYLRFNGNCREVMNFYKECLGGELSIMTYGDSQMSEGTPKELHDKVLHSYLKSGDLKLMASDDIQDSPEGFQKGNMISLCLVCKSKEEIETHFKKLSEGGQVTHELKEEFFGTFGDLTDKYGINWMLQFSDQQL
jgi:PhnB protein